MSSSQETEVRSQKAEIELVICPNPKCGSLRLRVISIWRAGLLIRRLRECRDCGCRFKTRQPPEELDPGVVKSAIATHGNKIGCHVKTA